MVIKMLKVVIYNLIFCSLVFLYNPLHAKESNIIAGYWDELTSGGDVLVKKTFKRFSDTIDKYILTTDDEISYLSDLIDGKSDLNIEDKIDSVRMYVGQLGELKKQEINASSFTIIRKSKKDYRIKIDKVLAEIEPLLFDGQIENYAARIRGAKNRIDNLEKNIVELNEKLVFAPEDGSFFEMSKKDLKSEIKKINTLIDKSETLIDKLEFDLKRKMKFLGIELSREQIRIMTSRIDGDDLAKSFAIFDVTKQISNSLGDLMQVNSFSGAATTKYYGVYVILGEILLYSQKEYISKIDNIYLPALDKIKMNISDSIDYANESLEKTENIDNQKILISNISANEYSLQVLNLYKEILIKQRVSIQNAVIKTEEQVAVSYSTYDTAVNSANLVNLISQSQENFNRIMGMQLPNIVPFENSELEKKFGEISDQLIKSTE
jgi:hypothetical protein